MKKQDVKLEGFLTVISPQQIVRIMDETLDPMGSADHPDDLTEFKGTAVKAFREYAGKGAMIKHVSPQLERDTGDDKPRYIMHIYIYQGRSNNHEIVRTIKGHKKREQDQNH